MPRKAELFRTLMAVALTGGHLEEQERRYLEAIAQGWGISVDSFTELEAEILRGDAPIAVPETDAKRRTFFRSVLEVACADGRITAEEREMLKVIAQACGFSEHDLECDLQYVMPQAPGGPSGRRIILLLLVLVAIAIALLALVASMDDSSNLVLPMP